MGQKIFLDSIYQSMQDSAREARLLLGPTTYAQSSARIWSR